MSEHIARTFTFVDDHGRLQRLDEGGLLSPTRPTVVLGEPGMGKTEVLRRFAATTGWSFRPAVSFVNHPRPATLVKDGAGLVVDGLDELAATQGSEPVNRVLGRLLEAGSPPFVLSCRAAEWRGAVARQDVADAYGSRPRELTLDPFSRQGAIEFLRPKLGATRAVELVGHLEGRAIADVYGNPLTLGLFGQVAATGAHSGDRDHPVRSKEIIRSVERDHAPCGGITMGSEV